jgi:hypothetical protein
MRHDIFDCRHSLTNLPGLNHLTQTITMVDASIVHNNNRVFHWKGTHIVEKIVDIVEKLGASP